MKQRCNVCTTLKGLYTKKTFRIMTFLIYTYILENVKMPNTDLYEENQSPKDKFILMKNFWN